MNKFKKLVILTVAAFLVLSFTVSAAVIYIVQSNHGFVLEHELMQGVTELLEDPDRLLTRGEFIRLVVALEQADLNTHWDSWLWDIFDDTPHADAIQWGNYHGIVFTMCIYNGFLPHFNITKEQAATMLGRYARNFDIVFLEDFENDYVLNTFSDQWHISYWSVDYVDKLHGAGVVMLDEWGNFNPQRNVTLEQAIELFERFARLTN